MKKLHKLPKGVENVHPHKNLHMDVYSSFTDNCLGRLYTCGDRRHGNSVLSAQFCCEAKTSLKKIILINYTNVWKNFSQDIQTQVILDVICYTLIKKKLEIFWLLNTFCDKFSDFRLAYCCSIFQVTPKTIYSAKIY